MADAWGGGATSSNCWNADYVHQSTGPHDDDTHTLVFITERQSSVKAVGTLGSIFFPFSFVVHGWAAVLAHWLPYGATLGCPLAGACGGGRKWGEGRTVRSHI